MVPITEILRCPTHGEPLTPSGDAAFTCPRGESYPVIDGIPVMLPDEPDRARLEATDWSSPTVGTSTLDFYNQSRDQEQYCRETLEAERQDVERWARERRVSGPALEIGSGRGALQGVGGEGDYVALDYGFTALRKYVDPRHARVCGTAERLPFPDRLFSLIFTVAALEHVPEADKAFAEVDRVLAPGGVAYLSPAWHCVQYNCDGIPVRPYGDLTVGQKWVKLTLPFRQSKYVKAAATLPGRVLRRAAWVAGGRRPTTFQFHRLRAEYERFWLSDSDACSRLDSHEGCLFFESRGYEVLSPGSSARRQLLCGHQPVVVRKRISS